MNNPHHNAPLAPDQQPTPNSPNPAARQRSRWWAAERRHTLSVIVGTSLASTAVTLLAGWLAILFMRHFESRDRVTVIARGDEPGVTMQLTSSANGVNVAQTLPTPQPLKVPPGEYRVQVSADGRVSQVHDATLAAGSTYDWKLQINDQRAMPPLAVNHTWTTFTLDGAPIIAVSGAEGIQLFDGKSSSPVRSLVLEPAPDAVKKSIPAFEWHWQMAHSWSGHDLYDARPWFVADAFDLNRDGHHDFLCAARHQAWLLAISGHDGKLLWAVGHGSTLRALEPNQNHIDYLAPVESANLHPPQQIADLDGDGTPEILATFGELTQSARNLGSDRVVSARRYVECLSGATGQSLWQRPLDDALFEITVPQAADTSIPNGATRAKSTPATPLNDGSTNAAQAGDLGESSFASIPEEREKDSEVASKNREIPVAWKWFVGVPQGSSSYGGGSSFYGNGRFVRDHRESVERNDAHVYRPSTVRVVGANREPRRGVVVAGDNVLWLDLKSGEVVETIKLPSRPFSREKWADVDGDGVEELVYLVADRATGGSSQRTGQLVVWSLATKSALWSHKLAALLPVHVNWEAPLASWPLLADLDDDGAAEVIVPDGGSRGMLAGAGAMFMPFGDLVVFAGKNGERRWTARIPTADQQIDHFIEGPDVNGDGHREIYAISLSDRELNVYLDVLSGRDGRKLWSKQLPPAEEWEPRSPEVYFLPLRWWQAGGDGWPQLLITFSSSDGMHGLPRLYGVSAGTGRINRQAIGIHDLQVVDVDGDAVEDLLTFAAETSRNDGGGKLDSVRGAATAPWSRVDGAMLATVDFDGDGVRDLVGRQHDGQALVARSGATGITLWRSQLDVSRDAMPCTRYGVSATSGIYFGQGLINSEATRGTSGNDDEGNFTADLNGDGVLDLLAWCGDVADWSSSPWPALVALSGRDGRLIWRSRDVTASHGSRLFGFRVVDLDHDGTSEILLAAAAAWQASGPNQTNFGNVVMWWLFAIDGATGRLRWAHPLMSDDMLSAAGTKAGSGNVGSWATAHETVSWRGDTCYPIPTFDLDADGVLDCILPVQTGERAQFEYRAVSGRDGSRIWRHVLLRARNPYVGPERLVAPHVMARNGRPEVFITEIGVVESPTEGQREVVQWTALDGRDGTRLWTTRSKPPGGDGLPVPAATSSMTEDPFVGDISFQDFDLAASLAARPTPFRREGGRVHMLSRLSSYSRDYLFFIDPAGSVRQSSISCDHGEMVVLDVEGDGKDEFAFIRDGHLQVVPSDNLNKPLWKRPIQVARRGPRKDWLEGYLPARDGRPPELRVVDMFSAAVLIGLDARTGAVRWQAPVTNSRIDVDWETCLDDMSSAIAEDAPPLVAYSRHPVTRVVRSSRAVDRATAAHQAARGNQSARGDQSAPGGPAASDDQSQPITNATPVSPTVASRPRTGGGAGPLESAYPERARARTTDDMPPGGDPRWRRPLPWNDMGLAIQFGGWVDTLRTLVSFAALGLTLVVLPCGYVGRSVLRRQWSLRSLFVLPLLAGLALTVWRWCETLTTVEKLYSAPLSAPPVLVVLWLASWTVRRNWRRLRIWMLTLASSTLGVSVLCGAWLFWQDRAATPLQPGEYYGWDNWYFLLFPVFYFMTWIMVLVIAAHHAWRLIRRPAPQQ